MRPFTPWRGVDSLSIGVVSPSIGIVSPCLGFCFLNPSAYQVCLHCIDCHILYILFFPCILFEEPPFLSLDFLFVALRNFCRYILGMTEKACHYFSILVKSNLSPRGQVCSYLHALSRCSFPFNYVFVVFVFYFSTKKMGKMIVPLYSFSDILCMFNWCLSSWCINYFCLYINESFLVASLLYSCFSHTMKNVHYPRLS